MYCSAADAGNKTGAAIAWISVWYIAGSIKNPSRQCSRWPDVHPSAMLAHSGNQVEYARKRCSPDTLFPDQGQIGRRPANMCGAENHFFQEFQLEKPALCPRPELPMTNNRSSTISRDTGRPITLLKQPSTRSTSAAPWP